MSTTPPSGSPAPALPPLHHGTTVTSARHALELFHDGVHAPLRPEVMLMALDAHQQVLLVLRVDQIRARTDVIDVLEVMIELAAGTPTTSVVLASVHPGEPPVTDDMLIWWTLFDMGNDAGLEVLDWFVLGEEFLCDPWAGQSVRRLAEGDNGVW